MSILSRLFSKGLKNPNEEHLKNKLNQGLFGFGANFTKYDDKAKTYLTEGYNGNSDVYSVISQKAAEVTRIPYMVKSVKDSHQKERYGQFMNMVKGVLTPATVVKKIQHEKKAFGEQELPLPLDKPNINQTWREFFALYETFMDLTGNFYIYLKSPEDGMNQGVPLEMYILPSHLMQIVLKDSTDLLTSDDPISHYVLIEGNSFIKFERDEVVHIKYPNPNYDLQGSHLYGQSPLRAALTNIQSSNSASLLNAKTLANGGSFGFISTKEPLTELQAKGLKDRLVEMDNSKERISNLAGSSKEVVFTRINLTTDELQPFSYLEYDQKAICNVLHWDDKLLNSDEGAKYDNYKVALRRAITTGVSPNLRLLESAFNNDILPRYKNYQNTVLIFDESQLPEMQEDMEKLTRWLNDTLDRGVINRDEYRLAINYAESGVPQMTEFTVSSDIMSLEEALDGGFGVDAGEQKNLIYKAGFDPNQPRASDGRWGYVSGWHKIDTKEQTKNHTENGGSTYTMDGKNQAGAKGMASVATFPERSITLKGILTSDALNDYIELNKDLLEGNVNFAVGTWYDSETGVTWLDVITVTNLKDAIKLGIKHNQIAIFDLENMDEVSTGGTGKH